MEIKKLNREDLKENIVVIKINQSYREGMSALELYDVTRGCWKRKLESVERAEYVLAVAYGIVKEVYKVNRWFPAEQLKRKTIQDQPEDHIGRIAFEGNVAEESIRSKYVDKSVTDLYKFGEADPVKVFFKEADLLTVPNNLNVAAKPALVIQTETEPMIVCPVCEYSFIKAPRCPECGQLILYERERWNKPKLANLDVWGEVSEFIGVTSKETVDFIRRVSQEDGFSYHIGAVDLAIDFRFSDSVKPVQVMMLFGKSSCGAFQPKELIEYLKRNDMDGAIAEWYMGVMKPYLSPEQKNVPYERLNGYYYIDFSTMVKQQEKLIETFMQLRDKMRSNV